MRAPGPARSAILTIGWLASSACAAAAAQDEADLCGLKPVFMEDFNTQSIGVRELGFARWTAHTPWNGDFGDAGFGDPGPGGPFTVADGVLSITARKGPDGKWRSGLIAAADHTGAGEGLRYGYFESRMKLPPGPGTWPSFWLGTLRPADAPGPGIEIDVIEYYGQATASFQAAVHVWSKDPAETSHQVHKVTVPANALTDAYHTFGVRVAADLLTFYFDRTPVWQVATPKELTLPLFPLANLALGSGFPIDRTPNPSVLLIDYVHVYALDPNHMSGSCVPLGSG